MSAAPFSLRPLRIVGWTLFLFLLCRRQVGSPEDLGFETLQAFQNHLLMPNYFKKTLVATAQVGTFMCTKASSLPVCIHGCCSSVCLEATKPFFLRLQPEHHSSVCYTTHKKSSSRPRDYPYSQIHRSVLLFDQGCYLLQLLKPSVQHCICFENQVIMEEGVAWCPNLHQNFKTNIEHCKKWLIHVITGLFTGAVWWSERK